MDRISWDDYFVKMLDSVSERATCDRGKSSCIIVRDNQVLSTGYVGSVHGVEHCDEVGHLFIKNYKKDGTFSQHCIRTVHAEQNAVAHAAKKGISLNLGTAYITMEPCFSCAKLLIQSGILRIVCVNKYHDSENTRLLMKQKKIDYVVLNDKELYND